MSLVMSERRAAGASRCRRKCFLGDAALDGRYFGAVNPKPAIRQSYLRLALGFRESSSHDDGLRGTGKAGYDNKCVHNH